MNGTTFEGGPSDRCTSAGTDDIALPIFAHLGGGSITGDDPKYLTLRPREQSRVCVCKPRRVLNEGFEHGPKIERRPTDDFEHIGRGSLLLQGFAQLTEQARIVDGDDGLTGEALEELDLLVGKRSD